jgi:hypothetical protein
LKRLAPPEVSVMVHCSHLDFFCFTYNTDWTDPAGMHSCDWHGRVTRNISQLCKPSQDMSPALGCVMSTYGICYSQDMSPALGHVTSPLI